MDKQTESGTQRQKRPLAKLTDSETDKVDCLSKYNRVMKKTQYQQHRNQRDRKFWTEIET